MVRKIRSSNKREEAVGHQNSQLTSPKTFPIHIDLSIDIMPISGAWPGRVALYNEDVGPWGTRISGILFKEEKIKVLADGKDNEIVIGDYEKHQWYNVRLFHDMTSMLYDAYINGNLLASSVSMGTIIPTSINMTAGNNNVIYFDNIAINHEGIKIGLIW